MIAVQIIKRKLSRQSYEYFRIYLECFSGVLMQNYRRTNLGAKNPIIKRMYKLGVTHPKPPQNNNSPSPQNYYQSQKPEPNTPHQTSSRH